jgi:hypothetical protein
LQDAIKGLQDGSFLTILEAARNSRVCCRLCDVGRNTTYYSFQVQQTLQNQFKGQTVSRHKAAEKAQILVPEEEGVLSEWCGLHGLNISILILILPAIQDLLDYSDKEVDGTPTTQVLTLNPP